MNSLHLAAKKRKCHRWLVAGLMALFAPVSNRALAQRGIPLPYQAPAIHPSSGISGFFDTNLADKNYFVADFPTFSVDYGFSHNMTIGTTLLTVYSAAQLLNKGKQAPFNFFNGKIRYRIFSNSGWSAALTGYYAALQVKGGQGNSAAPRAFSYLPAATLNVAHELQTGSAGISFLLAQASSVTGSPFSANYERSDKLYKLLTGWWRRSLTTSIEGEILATICAPTISVELSNLSRVDISQSCFSTNEYSGFLRGLMSWRSSQTWLWSVGAIWTPNSTRIIIPVVAAHHVAELFTGTANTQVQPATETEND